MLSRKFENNEEKDEFWKLAVKKHFTPLENFISENFTTDTVVIVAHNCAKIQNESYENFFAEMAKLGFK